MAWVRHEEKGQTNIRRLEKSFAMDFGPTLMEMCGGGGVQASQAIAQAVCEEAMKAKT